MEPTFIGKDGNEFMIAAHAIENTPEAEEALLKAVAWLAEQPQEFRQQLHEDLTAWKEGCIKKPTEAMNTITKAGYIISVA